MNDTVSLVWEDTLRIIKEELSDLSFKTWFENIEPLRLDPGEFYVLSDNDFDKGMLEQRYKTLINNALSQILKEPCQVNIVLNTSELPVQTADYNTHYAVEEENNLSMNAGLNAKYTFDTFVVGENNRFANAACVAVSESPSERYNPLFIYGGVGLGKTHLMQAVGNYVLSYQQERKVVYVSCENFTNEFINSIQKKDNLAFREKYRNVDILLIDDIQFLTGKEGTQEEFFHTFNTLHESNKQIVISSDRPPKEIPKLEDRLRSRFEMGLITDISTPNFETRLAIIKKKAELYSEEIPDDVLGYIADSIHSNIRELEGALTTVNAFAKLQGKPITLPIAKEALKDLLHNREGVVINADYIKEITAKYHDISIEEMDSKKRTKAIARPRQVAMYITRELTDMSLPKIGEAFGGRDHTTVIHACKKIEEDMNKSSDFKNLILRIMREITQE